MNRVCRFVVAIFGMAYLLAMALFVIGTFGLFGSERGPLAGIFLVPLGLPWNLLLNGVSDAARPWLAAAAPAVNIIILWLICRLLSSARRDRG